MKLEDIKISMVSYKLDLQKSYFPAVKSGEIWDRSVGEELRLASFDSSLKTALVEVNESGKISRKWNFQELYNDAIILAKHLLIKHKKGDRIAVWSSNKPEWVLLEYGVALAGLVLVTVNPSYQVDELKYVLSQSESSELFLCRSFRGNPMWRIANEVCNSIGGEIEMTDIEDVTKIVLKGDIKGELPEVQSDDPFQIQYTSGTTGFPKGAMLHHKGLLNNAKFYQERMEAKNGDKFLNSMPLFHCAGSGMATLGCLTHRSEHYLMSIFDPIVVGKVIEKEKITQWGGVPTMFVQTLKAQNNKFRDFSSLKSVSSGGSNVPPALAKEIKSKFNIDVQIVYGQTEASPVITLAWPNDQADQLKDTVGQPLPNIEVSINSTDNGKILPIGEVGEICCRGYNIMLGYFNNNSETEKTISNSGWLRTGDLGYMDRNGYIRVTGRTQEMIIRGGENIYPKEIENCILENNAISEVAVIGVPDEIFGEVIACFLKFNGSYKLGEDELKKFIRVKLSAQKTPKYWINIEEWPLTASGKIQKFVLREKFLNGEYERGKV